MTEWQVEMADIISEIARNLVAKHGSENRGILLLSGISTDSITYSVFIGKQVYIQYCNVVADDRENLDLLWELAFIPPPASRCEAIEMFIKSGKLTTNILYAKDIDLERDEFEVRDEVVHSYFGDGKIVYPPMPFGSWEL